MSGSVTIRFWGRLSDSFGASQVVDLPAPKSLSDLRYDLGDMLVSASIRAIINGVFVKDDIIVKTGDTVEFLPPVGGG